MPFSLTTNYAGIASSGLISAAINSAPTVAGNNITVFPGIKSKMNVRKADWSTNLVQAAACDYNSQGTLTLSEVILDPTDLMTNQTLCKSDLEQYWIASNMRAGALNSDMTTDFRDYILNSMMAKVGEALESNLWSGNLAGTAYSGVTSTGFTSFAGFIRRLIDAGDSQNITGYALTENNVISAMTQTYLRVPARARNPRLTFYVSRNTAAYYQLAVAGRSNETYVNQDGSLITRFMGYNVAVTHGMPDNHIIAGDPENFFVGTDLLSDANNVQLIDMTPIDGSMNVRMVARYKFGTQIGYTNEVAWFRTTS